MFRHILAQDVHNEEFFQGASGAVREASQGCSIVVLCDMGLSE